MIKDKILKDSSVRQHVSQGETFNEPLIVFIGYDEEKETNYHLAKQSILETASAPVAIFPLKQHDLRNEELYWRTDLVEGDEFVISEFTFTRFLVPYLMDYKGWALYLDCDFIFKNDISSLFFKKDKNFAVSCVQHKQKIGTDHPKKEWASMMLFNCAHKQNKKLNLELINHPDTTGAFLHEFKWLKNHELGILPHQWNRIIGLYDNPKDGKPSAIHYTQEWLENPTNDSEYILDWHKVENAYLRSQIIKTQKQLQREKERVIDIDDLTLSPAVKKVLNNVIIKRIDPNQKFYKLEKEEPMGKVVAIAPDEEGFKNKGLKYDPYCEDFVKGAGGTISTWNLQKGTKWPLVIRGLGGTSRKAITYCKENNRVFYAIDTGYMGNEKTKIYHRITKNGVQNTGPIIERPTDRLEKIGWSTRGTVPYESPKKKSKRTDILICPPSKKVMVFYNQDLDTWMKQTVAEIKKYTDRNIVMRLKPPRGERVTTNTIQQAFDKAYCVVTFNSIAATEALLYGLPAIALAPNNSARLLCNTSINEIENLNRPTIDEITAFAAHLSYCQFTSREMKNGYAWEILNESN